MLVVGVLAQNIGSLGAKFVDFWSHRKHCIVEGMYQEKPFKILGTSPLLAHALSNAWDRPNLGTGFAREHDDEHFSFISLAKTSGSTIRE